MDTCLFPLTPFLNFDSSHCQSLPRRIFKNKFLMLIASPFYWELIQMKFVKNKWTEFNYKLQNLAKKDKIEEYQNLSVTLCVTLCVTQPSYASLNHLRQDIDFINNFDTIWSSKWLWSIIFSSESDYLDDKTFQHMHVTCLKDEISIGPQGLVCICAHPIYGFVCLSVLHLQLKRDHWADKTCQNFFNQIITVLDKSCWDAVATGKLYQCDPSLQGWQQWKMPILTCSPSVWNSARCLRVRDRASPWLSTLAPPSPSHWTPARRMHPWKPMWCNQRKRKRRN